MPEEPTAPDREAARDKRTGRSAAANRIAHQHHWVDQQVRLAMERGEFDDLPGAGKPIEGLGTEHDPDWWVKKLVERERIAVLPPALALRKEDLELDAALDRENSERRVRETLEDFNRRVREAQRQLQGGPPVVTPPRDIDREVERWVQRRDVRRAQQAAALADHRASEPRRVWWRRGRRA